MQGVSRFTVSVPTTLLEALDRKLVADDSNRSAVIRRLVEQALRDAEEREDVARYVRGYQQAPQTEEEFGWFDVAARERLSEVPWE